MNLVTAVTQDGSTIYAWYPEDCQKCKDIVSGYHGLKKAQKDSVLLDLKEMLKGMRQVAASFGYCDTLLVSIVIFNLYFSCILLLKIGICIFYEHVVPIYSIYMYYSLSKHNQ